MLDDGIKRVLERQLDYSREWLMRANDATVAIGGRLTAWLVVGNAGALLALYSAGLQHRPLLMMDVFEAASWAFAIGLIAAVAATVVSYFGGLASVLWIGRKVVALTDMEALAARSDLTPEEDAQLEATHAELRRPSNLWVRLAPSVFAIVIYAGSMAAFATGLIVIVSARAELLALEHLVDSAARAASQARSRAAY